MRSFVALFRKELRSYFGSPPFYFVATAFLAYTGYYFHSDLIYFITFGFGLNIMENFWQILFVDLRLVLIFAVPLLTMRLLAEERRLGTLELLITYPLRDGAIARFTPFRPFSVGVIGLRDVFYFLYAAGLFVWATLRVLEARQWRGRR